MCGIVGYAGSRPARPIIFDGLRHLEYRGYDSAGIAILESDKLDCVRAVGNLDALAAAIGKHDGSSAVVGLGHTRWATHGKPSHENAHPHDDCSQRVSIVLNGIIENYKELRAELTGRGHTLTSETDAEVVAHLIEEQIGDGLAPAVQRPSVASTATSPSAPSASTSPGSSSVRATRRRWWSAWARARALSPRRSPHSWRTRGG